MIFAIRLRTPKLKLTSSETNTKINIDDPKPKALFRPSPDLSVVSLTDLFPLENVASEKDLIHLQLTDGTSYSQDVWKYIISFDGSVMDTVPSQIALINTPKKHPCHWSIVPENFNYKNYLKGQYEPGMHFHLKSLSEVYEAIITHGTLHQL